ncbi:hypothetical protein C8J57DRAFT_1313545 [Mycena rebaudengoi]|nr:hypothetical protein C8J57DRAFT_1313545 [Mycena rebaudengoi]
MHIISYHITLLPSLPFFTTLFMVQFRIFAFVLWRNTALALWNAHMDGLREVVQSRRRISRSPLIHSFIYCAAFIHSFIYPTPSPPPCIPSSSSSSSSTYIGKVRSSK